MITILMNFETSLKLFDSKLDLNKLQHKTMNL